MRERVERRRVFKFDPAAPSLLVGVGWLHGGEHIQAWLVAIAMFFTPSALARTRPR